MKIEFGLNYSVEAEECNIDYLTAVFKQLLVMIFTDFVKTCLAHSGDSSMKMMKKPFRCSCGNDIHFIWKARDDKPLKITTIFADLRLPRMQAQCKSCGRKMFISRLLLGIARYQKMSSTTQKMPAFVGALTPFRVAEKIPGMFSASPSIG